MSKVQVFDLPTRGFHFLFTVLFITSFCIGKFVDDESTIYAYHMLSGMLMTLLVLLRIVWGIIGTEYAKFKSFNLNLKELISYFIDVLSGLTKREYRHNPATSFAAIGMFFFTFFLGITGLLMINKVSKDFFEEVHEVIAILFLALALFHIAGVLLHEYRHRDGLVFSMLNGKKEYINDKKAISSQRITSFVIFILIMVFSSNYLLSRFDTKQGNLKIFGLDLKLVNHSEKNIDFYNDYYNMDEPENE